MKRLLTSIFLLGLVGCGDGDVDGCDFRADEDRCQERVRNVADPAGTVSAAFRMTCEAAGGTFLDDGCPAEGRVAGCEIGTGGETTTDWYYGSKTRADVEAACGDDPVVDP